MLTRRTLTAWLVTLLPTPALAGTDGSETIGESSPSESDGTRAPAAGTPRLDRRQPRIERLPTRGSDIETGAARIVIHAPLADVRRVLLRFRNYHKILPRLTQSRVVGGKKGTYTDVYMRAPIMHGVAHIWGVMRFSAPKRWAQRGETISVSYLDGNLDDFRGRWYMFPCGPKRTTLRIELFLDPSIPVPDRIVGKWLAWAAGRSVAAVRDIVECGSSSVAAAEHGAPTAQRAPSHPRAHSVEG